MRQKLEKLHDLPRKVRGVPVIRRTQRSGSEILTWEFFIFFIVSVSGRVRELTNSRAFYLPTHTIGPHTSYSVRHLTPRPPPTSPLRASRGALLARRARKAFSKCASRCPATQDSKCRGSGGWPPRPGAQRAVTTSTTLP
jgi:hypothetical protein